MINLKKNKNLVEHILTEDPETRDNDYLLMMKVWAHRHPELRNPGYSFLSFASLFVKAKLTSPESIRRVRQKLQEHNPELRGKLYDKRHTRVEEIQQEIKDIGSEEMFNLKLFK